MTRSGRPAGTADGLRTVAGSRTVVGPRTADGARIVVVGAGPAGLWAGWQAAAAGHQVTIVERAPQVGGMAASLDVAGLRVDLGSHRLHPSTPPAILGRLRHLLGDDLQTRPRNGRIHLAGRWLGFPLRTGDLLRNTPRPFALGAARDALTGPLRTAGADTFAEVVRAGLGPTVADEFYGPYVRKIWGVDPAELSGELARRRVSASSPADIVRRLVRGARPEGRVFLYPRRGFGQLSEALAEAAVAAGAELRLDTEVRSLDPG
ncbi:MAG: Protoporphyrinogen oxidase-like protein, partial [Acidimicrobiales bacterium]|nr:Protoporphyrinogen oxidase-like protein [Acidimicrobiales bacterium]